MIFAQGPSRLTTHFSERIPVVKRRISVSLCMTCERYLWIPSAWGLTRSLRG